jgi:hypothetical protein
MGPANRAPCTRLKPSSRAARKVGSALHAIGNGACAHGIGEIDDPSAGPLFAAIAVTASDLELDKGKIVKPHKQRPFGSEIADRDGEAGESSRVGSRL